MAIELTEVASGYSTGVINSNFEAIEAYINDNLLNRDGTTAGEVNQLELDIDVNNHRLFNLPLPINSNEAARLIDVQNAIEGDTAANLISFTPTAPYTSDTVQGALEEVQFVDTSTGTDQPLAEALNNRELWVADLAGLKALSLSELVANQTARITTTGRAGVFTWTAGDQSANVTADPLEGVWVAPNDAPTGASGAWQRSGLNELGVSPEYYGAPANGVDSDAAAFQAAMDSGYVVRAEDKSWLIDSTVDILSFTTLLLDHATITADCGTAPVFAFHGAKEALYIRGNGGLIKGTASAAFSLKGSTSTPSSLTDYARDIHIFGIAVSEATIVDSIKMEDAVRQVFIDGCFFLSHSAINASGKIVEVKVTKSILFSADGGAGSKGVLIEAKGTGSLYPEGFHFTDCTISNYERCFDVRDIFVLTLQGGFVSSDTSSDYALHFSGPVTSTHCREISVSNVTLGGKVMFNGGNDFRALISDVIFSGVDGVQLDTASGAQGISVRGVRFTSATGTAVGCRFNDNSGQCSVSDIYVDSTFSVGVQFIGLNGSLCSLYNVSVASPASPFYAERPVFTSGIQITSSVWDDIFSVNTTSLGGSYAVSDTISSGSMYLSRGQSGWIVGEMSVSGAASPQIFKINIPSGLEVPKGSGWDSTNVRFFGDGRVTFRIPVYASSSIPTGSTLSLTNDTGNTVSIGSHGFFGLEKAN